MKQDLNNTPLVELPPTYHKNIIRKAKYDALTHQIIHSQKWLAVVGPFCSASRYSRIAKNLTEIVTQLPIILNTLEMNTPKNELLITIKTKAQKLPSEINKGFDGLPPELIEEHLPNILRIWVYLAKLNDTILNITSDDNLSYTKTEEYIILKKGQENLLTDYIENENILWDLRHIINEITNIHATLKTAGTYIGSVKECKRWQLSVLAYYKQAMTSDPKILDLPHRLTINPKYTINNSTIEKIFTFPKDITLPIAAPQITKSAKINKETFPTAVPILNNKSVSLQKTTILPESTQSLLNEFTKNQETMSYLYDILNPEEQHIVESLIHNHIPNILKNLALLNKTKSSQLSDAITKSNQVITQANIQLHEIIATKNNETFHNLETETKSVIQILNINKPTESPVL